MIRHKSPLFRRVLNDTPCIYLTPSDFLSFGPHEVFHGFKCTFFRAFLEPSQVVCNQVPNR